MALGRIAPEGRCRPIKRSLWSGSMPYPPASNISRYSLPSPLENRLGLSLSGRCRNVVDHTQSEVELPTLQSAFVSRFPYGSQEIRG